ncbi:MAG: hypothetical protein JWR15_4692 [Prosthecobacter sp.]|nr:hypothetical protein [Prosthecobacter sp.]
MSQATNADSNAETVKLGSPQSPSSAAPARSEGTSSAPILPEGYEYLRVLGVGGMGRVVKAQHKLLGRCVAIKTLLPQVSFDLRFTRRFQKEAQALAAIHHPNIVTIHDFGELTDGSLYLVMELVEGPTLRHRLKAGPLDFATAMPLIQGICAGLSKAHEAGITHRDLKPENILLSPAGMPKVADFGLAVTASSHDSVFSSQPMGTLTYMAPEQKIPNADVSPATDVFALGLILYELIAGRVPEGAFDPLAELVGTPAALDDVIRRCLQADPKRRFANASQMALALTNCIAPTTVAAAPPVEAISRRHLLFAACGAGGVLSLGFIGGWFMLSSKIDLLEKTIEKIAINSTYTAQPDGGALLDVQHEAQIRFLLLMQDKPPPVKGLRVRCDSSRAIKTFRFTLTDGEHTWEYVHPKPVPAGRWDTTIAAEKFSPPLDLKDAGPLKNALLILSPDDSAPGGATMVMNELSLVR